MEEKNDYSKQIFAVLVFFAVILFFTILKFTYSVTMPIFVAGLISLLFYPILIKLHKIHIPWTFSIILILLITIIVCAVIGRLLGSSVEAILASYQKYENRFKSIYLFIVEKLHMDYDENDSLLNNLWNSEKIRNWIQTQALSLSSNLLNTTKTLLMILLLLLFLLLEIRSIKLKSRAAFSERPLGKKFPHIVGNIINDVTRYVSIKFLASLATGILVYLSVVIIHMDFPIVWGFLAFVLNFIPTFGSIISWAATTLFSLIQYFPDWGYMVYVAVIVLAINQIIGSFLEPRIEGKGLGISPFVILVSLSIWGYIWGFVGMIVAVPFTVIMKIIFENTELLQPIAVIMGNERALKISKRPFFRKKNKKDSVEEQKP